MVSMPTHSEFEKGGSAYKVTHISAVTYPRLKTQITFIFEDNIFLHLSGPIGQIYAHNKMSDVFNLGLITPVAYYSLPMLFSIILRFH